MNNSESFGHDGENPYPWMMICGSLIPEYSLYVPLLLGSLEASLSLSLSLSRKRLRERIEMSGQNQGLQVISYKAT
jgi:hypothetical protein